MYTAAWWYPLLNSLASKAHFKTYLIADLNFLFDFRHFFPKLQETHIFFLKIAFFPQNLHFLINNLSFSDYREESLRRNILFKFLRLLIFESFCFSLLSLRLYLILYYFCPFVSVFLKFITTEKSQSLFNRHLLNCSA